MLAGFQGHPLAIKLLHAARSYLGCPSSSRPSFASLHHGCSISQGVAFQTLPCLKVSHRVDAFFSSGPPNNIRPHSQQLAPFSCISTAPATVMESSHLSLRRMSHAGTSTSSLSPIQIHIPSSLRTARRFPKLSIQEHAKLAPFRMQRHQKKLNPIQKAAAIAQEDLEAANSGFAPLPARNTARLGKGGIPVDALTPSSFDLLESDPFAPTSPALLPPSPTLPPEIAARLIGPTALALEGPEKRKRQPGILQSVPQVSPAHEHLASAMKRASRVMYNAAIKNEAEKERNRAARQLDTLYKELSVPLSRYVNTFPDPAKLHPFDAALLQLTINIGMYKSTLNKVFSLKKAVQEIGKQYANRAANAQNKAGALAVGLEGCQALERVFRNGGKAVDDLKEVAKKLRSLPVLDVALPTLALVGAPNVGKSSLVKILSSGTPEVCNYPFTTRSIKMGHFYLDGRKHQVTDTPGLLARPDEERNKMELLTLAALACLPTSVIFVIDLTEECGTSVRDQWVIRNEVKSRFPEKPWIDVFSKADMLTPILEEARVLGLSPSPQHIADAADGLSSAPGDEGAGSRAGHDESVSASHISQLVTAGAEVEQGRGGRGLDGLDLSRENETLSNSGSSEGGELKRQAGGQRHLGESKVEGASEVVGQLPDAVLVSALTGQGMALLQGHIVSMLTEQAEERLAAQAAAKEAGMPKVLGLAWVEGGRERSEEGGFGGGMVPEGPQGIPRLPSIFS